ncbi:MAG: type II toxin-antitoxin system prevent-host-death family antitoxin [Pseudomonadota bacterium]
MKKIALSEVKDDLSRYLRIAEKEEVLITRHCKPAGILKGNRPACAMADRYLG